MLAIMVKDRSKKIRKFENGTHETQIEFKSGISK